MFKKKVGELEKNEKELQEATEKINNMLIDS